MGVVLQNCLTDFCQPGSTAFTGFALIRLVNQADGMAVNASGAYIPTNTAIRVDIDPTTGCWTSCELECNNELAPVGTYYEIEEWVNGVCQGHHIVQLDCANVTYPNPTPLADVSLTNPNIANGGSLLAPVVWAHQSPWVGTGGPGIDITDGDSATGNAGNGHEPTVAVALSADAGNLLSFGTDTGLMALPTVIGVTDGDTIDLDLTGIGTAADPYSVTAEAIIDPDPANALVASAAGLFVSAVNVVDTDTNTADVTVAGTGTPADPFAVSVDVIVDPDADNIIEAGPAGLFAPSTNLDILDTTAIDHTLTGDGSAATPWTLSSAIIVSPLADNAFEVTALGAYVQDRSHHAVTQAPGITTTLTGDGSVATPWDLTVAPQVSGTAGNALAVFGDGLYVAANALAVTDTTSVDLTLTGAGTVASPWNVTAEAVIDPRVDNIIIDGAAGLYALQANVSVQGPALEGTGQTGDPVAVVVSPSAGNALQILPSGLYVAAEDNALAVADTATIDATLTGTGTTANPWTIEADAVIDPAVDNFLTSTAAGLFATADFAVTDSDTIDLALGGVGTSANPWNLTAEVVIDPASLGQVSVSAAGLRIDQTVVTVANTATIDTDITGAGTNADPYVIAANVVVDPAVDNLLTATAAGLSVTTATDLTYNPGTGDLTYTDPFGNISVFGLGIANVLTGTSYDTAANELTLGFADGSVQVINLDDLQDTYALAVTDTTSIDLTLTGNGSTATPWTIDATVIVDPAVDNAIVDGAAGLFVQEITGGNGITVTAGVVSTNFAYGDGLTGNGAPGDPISLVLDPAVDNAATLSPAGLYVAAPTIVSGDAGNLITPGADGGAYLDQDDIRANVAARWDTTAPSPVDGALLTKNAAGELLIPPVVTTWLATLGVIGEVDPTNQGHPQRIPVLAGSVLTFRTPTLGVAADDDVIATIVDGAGTTLATATITAGNTTGTWDTTTATIAADTVLIEIVNAAGTAAAPGAGLLLPVLVTEA